MDLSGIIFVVLALAWAVYLIPQALRHHDEIARTRSIDRFSTAMRVLARREPVNRRDSRLVVTPARPGVPRMLVPSVEDARRPAARAASRQAPARAAARRRRHLLVILVLANLVVGGVTGFGYLPLWSVSIPGLLTLAYLFLCRHQVRRDNRVGRSTPAVVAEGSVAAPRRVARVEVPYGAPQVSLDDKRLDQVPPDEVATTSSAVALGQALWEPLPMTLPTYVTKPRAARTVRTIDLSDPNTWSSGRSEADSKLVEETAAARQRASKEADERRAVGS